MQSNTVTSAQNVNPSQLERGDSSFEVEFGDLPRAFECIGYRMILDAMSVSARRATRTKLRAMRALGGRCKRCHMDDPRCLQFDHIAGRGDGKERIGSDKLYREIEQGRLHDEYQLLCSNCNWIKRHENHETAWGYNRRGWKRKRDPQPFNSPRFRWPAGINGIAASGFEGVYETMMYQIADEKGIDVNTIPYHNWRVVNRERFNEPFGYVRYKVNGRYTDGPVESVK